MTKSSLFRVAFVASSALGLSIGAAMQATACDQWLAPAQMEVIQTNGPRIGFSVIQEGTNIHGFAKYYTTQRTIIGNYSGTIVGDVFHARVLWTYSGVSAIGQYSGRIKPMAGVADPKGYIFEGTTYDEYRQPPDVQYWNAYHFTYQPAASLPPPPPVKITEGPARDSATAVLSHAKSDAAKNAMPMQSLRRPRPKRTPPSTRCGRAGFHHLHPHLHPSIPPAWPKKARRWQARFR
jgi:hypothetical protein